MDPDATLILAAHGSAQNRGARLPVEAAVADFQARGVFAEVRCAFWKEDPPFAGAVERAAGLRVVVVPWFMAGGYYTETVLPREMGLAGRPPRRADGRRVVVTDPLGAHPRVASVLVERARAAGFDGSQALVILGHGTEKSPDSGRTTFEQIRRLREIHPDWEVQAVFLDQEPRLASVFDHCRRRDLVVAPFFAADGWHVSETIPGDLGLHHGVCRRDGRTLSFAAAAGSSPAMREIAWEMAIEALRLPP